MKTAEEYLTQNTIEACDLHFRTKVVDVWTTKEYARMKCKELLEIVAEKARIDFDEYWEAIVDKDSILNAVDLETFCTGTAFS